MTSALPASILDLAELKPAEAILLAVLREGLPDVPVFSQIPRTPPMPFVVIRHEAAAGYWHADPRFADTIQLQVQTFTLDTLLPDGTLASGDDDGGRLQEAVRVVLRNAWMGNWHSPELGTVKKIDLLQRPHRVTDWATASGPVQFADLPKGAWRYESSYEAIVRKPL